MAEIPPLSRHGKVLLALRVLGAFGRVQIVATRHPLPEAAQRLGSVRHQLNTRHPAARLSRAVDRTLRIGSWQPRCLIASLVLYRLLREQGAAVEVVIGLPAGSVDRKAHAWIELNGADVGPPPGRGAHIPFARFGVAGPNSARSSPLTAPATSAR